jgi:1-deoxy-D-xylulose-5-phosphate synthase
MARARTLQRKDYHVVALMGDGAATGGMAYEGLNDAAVSKEPLIVVLNDNELSIDKNVGGMATHLRQLRSKERYIGMKQSYRKFVLKLPGGRYIYRITHNIKDRLRRMLIPTTIFESMGFKYLGPIDGHDTERLISMLRIAKEMNCPVLIHVMTQKGRGYAPSEEHPKLFHGIGKFDPVSGEPYKKAEPTFSDAFGKTMLQLAQENPNVCAITAAMPGGTGLLEFKQKYPERLFDVGIAEEHAVSMAGGLAKQGMKPVVALYSTFLQRAYDMILQDICMLNLPVVLAIDRAGLVGEDGETHHGIYDVGFLRHAPGMRILCPASMLECSQMVRWAVTHAKGPVAIRYPRGGNGNYTQSNWGVGKEQICVHRTGKDFSQYSR